MKLLFLNCNELNNVLSEIKNNDNKKRVQCYIGHSENLDTDVLEMKTGDKVEEIPISSLFDDIGQYHNVVIESYDVIEIGDFGEGFAFMIQ